MTKNLTMEKKFYPDAEEYQDLEDEIIGQPTDWIDFSGFFRQKRPSNPPLTYPQVAPPDISLVPEACRYCPEHPVNGGSGICHCILGLTLFT